MRLILYLVRLGATPLLIPKTRFQAACFLVKPIGTQMRFKRFLFLTCISLLVIAILIVSLAPVFVSAGLRLWIARTARQDGLKVNVEKIEAPLLRPVIIQKLEVVTPAEAPFH